MLKVCIKSSCEFQIYAEKIHGKPKDPWPWMYIITVYKTENTNDFENIPRKYRRIAIGISIWAEKYAGIKVTANGISTKCLEKSTVSGIASQYKVAM